MHPSGLNRAQRREAVRLLLAMREVYPGDVDNALYLDAMKLDRKLPPPLHVTWSDAALTPESK
jgi:hypothetical protein